MKDPREVFADSALVLPGGGLRCYVHIPYTRPLLERGIPIRGVYGSSGGAMNAAGLDQAKSQDELLPCLDEAEGVWNFIHEHGPQVVFPFSWGNIHILRTHGWLPNKSLYTLLEKIDPQRIDSSPIKFCFKVMNDTTMREEIWSKDDPRFKGDPLLKYYKPGMLVHQKEEDVPLLLRGLVATAAMKPIFDPVKIGMDFFSDGGSISGLIMRAIRDGCKTIFVLFPYPQVYARPLMRNDYISKYLPWINDFIALHSAQLRARDHEELEKARSYNQRIRYQARISRLESADGLLESLRRWKARLMGTSERPEQIRIIPLYPNLPETFETKNFKKGDFAVARQRCSDQMNRLLDHWLS